MMNSLIRSLSFPVVWSMNRAATKRGFRGDCSAGAHLRERLYGQKYSGAFCGGSACGLIGRIAAE